MSFIALSPAAQSAPAARAAKYMQLVVLLRQQVRGILTRQT